MVLARVKIRGYRVVEGVEVGLGKVVFYGPNSGGKSSVMEVLAWLLSPRTWSLNPEAIREDFRVEVSSGGQKLVVEKVGSLFKASTDRMEREGPTLDHTIEALENFSSRALKGVRGGIAWVDACRASITTYDSEDHADFCAGEIPGVKPYILEKALDYLMDVVEVNMISWYAGNTYIKDCSTYIKDNCVWIKYPSLSLGRRRALAIIIAALTSKATFIEAFESGLHADLAANLLSVLGEINSPVVVETHLGLIVARALKQGFKAYYVDEGTTKKIESLQDPEIFKREIEAIIP